MSKKKLWVGFIIVILALGLIFVVCFSAFIVPPWTSDDSILSGNPCALPCWHQIEVGKTTKDELINLLHHDSFVPQWALILDVNIIRWYWTSEHRGVFRFDDNQVLLSAEINPNYEFPLQNFLNLYGTPEAVSARLDYYGGMKFAVKMLLYYSQPGMVAYFRVFVDPREKLVLTPDMDGYGVDLYGKTNSVEELITKIYRIRRDDFTKSIESQPTLEGHTLESMLSLSPIATDVAAMIKSEITFGWPGFGSIFIVKPGGDVFLSPLLLVTSTPS